MAQYHTRTFAIVKRDVFLPNTSCIVFLKKIQRRVSTPFALGHPIEARSILLAGDTKGDGVPFGRKNPKKPAVSWQGIQRAQEDGCGLELRSDCSGRQQPAASPEQRDTVTPRCLPIMPDSIIVLRNRSVSQLMPWHHFDITSRHHS